MNTIGVIFDFNGTMFFDSKIHVLAWKNYIEELTNNHISEEEISQYIHGRNSEDILKCFLGDDLTKEMINQFSQEKESIYRSLCLRDKDKLKLTLGIEDFLDYLIKMDIPMNIATAANYENLQFYFEIFDLYRWFDLEKIAYDDGIIKGKPSPDLYIRAAKNINIPTRYCLVFEDAKTGIEAAYAAGVQSVVAITGDSEIKNYGENRLVATIEDFTKLNKDMLN